MGEEAKQPDPGSRQTNGPAGHSLAVWKPRHAHVVQRKVPVDAVHQDVACVLRCNVCQLVVVLLDREDDLNIFPGSAMQREMMGLTSRRACLRQAPLLLSAERPSPLTTAQGEAQRHTAGAPQAACNISPQAVLDHLAHCFAAQLLRGAGWQSVDVFLHARKLLTSSSACTRKTCHLPGRAQTACNANPHVQPLCASPLVNKHCQTRVFDHLAGRFGTWSLFHSVTT